MLQDAFHLTERPSRESAVFVGGTNVLPPIAQDQESCNGILVRYQAPIEGDHPAVVLQCATRQPKYFRRFRIPKVVQQADGEGDVEARQARDFFKVEVLALEMPAIAKSRLCGFDVFRADIVTPILHARGKKGEDVGRTASYVQDALPRPSTDESIH